jgi:hypothetical protein
VIDAAVQNGMLELDELKMFADLMSSACKFAAGSRS